MRYSDNYRQAHQEYDLAQDWAQQKCQSDSANKPSWHTNIKQCSAKLGDVGVVIEPDKYE